MAVSLVACPVEFTSKNTDADPIISLSKAGCGNDEFAINFIPADLDQMAIKVVKVGRMVDVEADGKWNEGVVKIVDVVTPRQVYLTVSITSQSGIRDIKVVWPSRNVAYCGQKMKARKCDLESKDPQAKPEAIRINFGKNPVAGWIHDNGAAFDKREGQNFGW